MPYTDFNWVSDRLAIGGMVTDSDDLPFDAVLSLETVAPVAVGDLVRAQRVDYQWWSIIDGTCYEEHDEIVRRFDAAAEQLDRWHAEGKRTLVHCMAGVSRSVTAVNWYLVRYQGYTWDQALATIRVARPRANPNIRFEIPLRMAAGETFTEERLRERTEAWARRVLEQTGIEIDADQIRLDLEQQGTFALLESHAR